MKFVKSLLKRPVSVLVLLLAVIVFGGAALTGMPLNFMPDFSMPVQLVIVTWPGSDAESVDQLVAKPITDKCETLSDISSTVTYSYDNYAMVQLVYNYGADEDDIYSDLKSAMDNLKASLPSDCNDPTIMQISADAMSTMTLSVSADSGVDIASVLDDKIKIAHAKDCKRAVNLDEKFGGGSAEHNSFRGAGAVELPGAGLGVLNYPLYVELLAKHHPNIPIIIEHIDESDIPRAKKFVDDTLKKMGV